MFNCFTNLSCRAMAGDDSPIHHDSIEVTPQRSLLFCGYTRYLHCPNHLLNISCRVVPHS